VDERAGQQIVISFDSVGALDHGGARQPIVFLESAVPGKARRFSADADNPEVEGADDEEGNPPDRFVSSF
jgi:hypothetical protein